MDSTTTIEKITTAFGHVAHMADADVEPVSSYMYHVRLPTLVSPIGFEGITFDVVCHIDNILAYAPVATSVFRASTLATRAIMAAHNLFVGGPKDGIYANIYDDMALAALISMEVAAYWAEAIYDAERVEH